MFYAKREAISVAKQYWKDISPFYFILLALPLKFQKILNNWLFIENASYFQQIFENIDYLFKRFPICRQYCKTLAFYWKCFKISVNIVHYWLIIEHISNEKLVILREHLPSKVFERNAKPMGEVSPTCLVEFPKKIYLIKAHNWEVKFFLIDISTRRMLFKTLFYVLSLIKLL